jgi:diguanylate cyclase (GGDEF)-like protein
MPTSQEKRRLRARTRIFWPISLLALIIVVALVSFGVGLAKQMDSLALLREQKVVENGIAQRVAEVARLPLPQVVWDDAVRNLDNRFSPDWAKQNVGHYLDQTDHFDGSYVIDADGKPIFAFRDHMPALPSSYARLASKAAPLLADVRRAEARQRKASVGSGKLGEPLQSSGMVSIDGALHILTATLVQPDFGTAQIKGPRAPILITDMEIDGEFLEQFASRFLLVDLHVHPGNSSIEPDEAHVALRDRTGSYVATVDWSPQKPGAALISKMGVPALALICFLVLAVLYLFHRSIRFTEELITSKANADHLIHFDGLTGLPNRLSFMTRLNEAIEQLRESDEPIAVLSIDLDGFEEIGKTFGHRAAEDYVAEAARRMARHCRPTDMIARFSADEFGLVMLKAEAETASRLAARLCAAVAMPMDINSERVFGGCTIGISLVSPVEDISATDALRYADIALHRAKVDARGHYCLFENEMDAVVKARRALELDLRNALEGNAMDLHYQPQVDRHGYMTGAEALIRWHDPARGQVSPAKFVPIAEQCGLIMQLGMFTLRRAFHDSKRWPGLRIAINVSAMQIVSEDFLPQLRDLVREMKVDPQQFELEITEGILINDDPQTQDRLQAMRKMGFALALDDFGTGYSSLSYLSRYPINKIKIDRSFILNLGKDSGADAVVSAIIRLARALKLAVIAEGVETEDQRGQLTKAGCHNIQGYLYSRAVPAEEIDHIYSANAPMIVAARPLAA